MRRVPSRGARVGLVFAVGLAVAWEIVLLRYFGVYRLHTPREAFWGVADDVYISADFARTFVDGQGLLWYPGAPRVEGFSNPLWVLILSILHRLPFFTEERLGIYLLFVNVIVMGLLAMAFGRGIRDALAYRPDSVPPSNLRVAFATVVAASGCTMVCFCAAIGFETALTTLLAFAAFVESRKPQDELRHWKIAVYVGLAFWSRMDSLLISSAALLSILGRFRIDRRVLTMGAIIAGMIAVEFVARRAYFGDFLPNTYYLKATGWPWKPRMSQGAALAGLPLGLCALLAFPLWAFSVRRIPSVATPVSLSLLAYVLTLGYSVYNGSDLIVAFGYDRFTGAGVVFLMFSLVLLVLRARGAWVPIVGVSAFLIGTGPMWTLHPRDGLANLARFLDLRKPPLGRDRFVEIWTDEGKLLREVTRPGARVALCGAGALVYFSHRGGVDLLGKVEPMVAHLPVLDRPPPEPRCWRGFPGAGHNKEDIRSVFGARRPEVSMVEPPARQLGEYERVRYGAMSFFALRGTSFLDWSRVDTKPR